MNIHQSLIKRWIGLDNNPWGLAAIMLMLVIHLVSIALSFVLVYYLSRILADPIAHLILPLYLPRPTPSHDAHDLTDAEDHKRDDEPQPVPDARIAKLRRELAGGLGVLAHALLAATLRLACGWGASEIVAPWTAILGSAVLTPVGLAGVSAVILLCSAGVRGRRGKWEGKLRVEEGMHRGGDEMA